MVPRIFLAHWDSSSRGLQSRAESKWLHNPCPGLQHPFYPRVPKAGWNQSGYTPLCDIPSGCSFFLGAWTVTHSSLRVLCQVVAF